MLEIYSPSGKEEKLVGFLQHQLTISGFSNVHVDDVGNVYGEIGKGSPSILFCGHVDTVPGRMRVKVEDGRVYGRGAVDAKSSLASMISAAYELATEGIEGKVIVAGVVDEEHTAKGIRGLLRRQMRLDYVVFGEPSGICNITFAYKGRLAIKVICKTRTGHVGAQHLYSNAIEEAYALWGLIREALGARKSVQGVFYSVTPCLVSIRSRRSAASIPDECILIIDVRLPPTFGSAQAVDLVKSVFEQYRRRTPGATVDLSVIDTVEPFVAERNTLLMGALRESIEEILQKPPKFIRKTGTGDMNIFGSSTGLAVATYGPGDAHLSHTENEYVDLEEYKTSIMIYKKTVQKTICKHRKIGVE